MGTCAHPNHALTLNFQDNPLMDPFFSVIGQGLLLIGHSQCYQMGLADKENLTTAPHALLLQLWCPSKRNMKMSQSKRRGTGTTGKQHNPYSVYG